LNIITISNAVGYMYVTPVLIGRIQIFATINYMFSDVNDVLVHEQ